MHAQFQKVISSFAARVGLTVVWEHNDKCMWEPKTKTIYRTDPSDALHEIAHYLVAATKHRTLPNFGLGHDYEFLVGSLREEVTGITALKTEARASCVGIMLEEIFGMDYHKTMHFHSWTLEEYNEAKNKEARDRSLKKWFKIAMWEAENARQQRSS